MHPNAIYNNFGWSIGPKKSKLYGPDCKSFELPHYISGLLRNTKNKYQEQLQNELYIAVGSILNVKFSQSNLKK